MHLKRRCQPLPILLLRKKDVLLWCDARSESSKPSNIERKCRLSLPPSRRKQIEDQVDNTVERERHYDRYTLPQIHLWARMISTSHHESLDDPPQL